MTTPLEELEAALQRFVNSEEGQASLLRGAVILWESMSYDDDGEPLYTVSYRAVAGASMAAAIGIIDLGKEVAVADVMHVCGHTDP